TAERSTLTLSPLSERVESFQHFSNSSTQAPDSVPSTTRRSTDRSRVLVIQITSSSSVRLLAGQPACQDRLTLRAETATARRNALWCQGASGHLVATCLSADDQRCRYGGTCRYVGAQARQVRRRSHHRPLFNSLLPC